MKKSFENEYEYLVLTELKDLFIEEIKDSNVNFEKVKIIGCQHLLEGQLIMIKNFIELGFLPVNIYILGKIYSTSDSIVKELAESGVNVLQPKYNLYVSFDLQHKTNCEELLNKVDLRSDDRLVVLDDGGQFIEIVNSKKLSNIITAVEQTSSGFRRLENVTLDFPVYNVARSPIKLQDESPLIANHAYQRIKLYIDTSISNPNVLVVGLGPIGVEILKCIKNDNKNVIGYDKNDGEKNIVNLIKDNNINVVIGATGAEIISHLQIIELSNTVNYEVHLVSVSSSDREFEVWKLRDLFEPDNEPHSDISYKNIKILNNGFPISFKGNRVELPHNQIEKTICLLFAAAIAGLIYKIEGAGLVDLPDKINDIIKK